MARTESGITGSRAGVGVVGTGGVHVVGTRRRVRDGGIVACAGRIAGAAVRLGRQVARVRAGTGRSGARVG